MSKMELATSANRVQVSAPDEKEHYTAVVMGAGLSGMAAAIQLKRHLGLEDVLVYEKTGDIGGRRMRYPVQLLLVLDLHEVQDKFHLDNIVFRTMVTSAAFSRETGLWHLTVQDLESGATRERTCNILISCLGGLTIPNRPPFDPRKFNGPVFHSAEWPEDVDLKGKDVVIVGNGCSAAQIMPEIHREAKSVTQVARSRQTFFKRIAAPDRPFLRFLMHYVPGVGRLLRLLMFLVTESLWKVSDIEKGAKGRADSEKELLSHMQETTPNKYWDFLGADFDVGAKRRVFDAGYYRSLHEPNVELVADDSVERAEGNTVYTKKGRELKADVVILATGFRVRDCKSPSTVYKRWSCSLAWAITPADLFPMKVTNGEGESLQERMDQTGVKTYQGTCVSSFPNFFWILGPNTATNHSSVLFTSEAQLALAFHLIRPVLAALGKGRQQRVKLIKPAPYVEVTRAAEDRYYAELRQRMKGMVWESKGGVAWYVDKATGLCTALYPWTQVHFWQKCAFPSFSDFKWTNCSGPWTWRSYLGWW
ncbi:hypothetical protein BMF94_0721 [Rhodotorula taiwanensis]|uniref:Uncharacterized protein n=1 Tax=Rhodotorula taiwanensis TaxID=741276 RepID=A0A2S5BHF8_9BASI|nr:hypothetical protein BMF94_0721 [Rhodotorula taiwanensis]